MLRILSSLLAAAMLLASGAQADPTPGIEVWVSDSMLESLFDQEIATSAPFDALVLGSRVRGTATTKAQSTVVLEPSASHATLRLEIAAQVAADASTQTDAPFNVQVWTQMKSQSYVHASKRFFLSPARFSALTQGDTVSTTATNPLEITRLNVGTEGAFKRIKAVIAYRSAWQQIWATRIQTQELTSARVQQEFNRQLDQEAQRVVDDANAKIYREIYRPLIDSGSLPGHPFVITSAKHLQMGVYDPAPDTDDAPAKPAFPREYDVHLRLRASYLEAAAKLALAGETLTETQLNDQVKALTGKEQAPVDAETMIAMTYADDKPLSLAVDAGKITLVMRTKKVMKGLREYPPLITRVTYELVRSPDGAYVLERLGDVEVLPPRAETDRTAALTMQEKVEQQFIRKKLRETVFTETIAIGKVAAPAGLKASENLFTKFAAADAGWLVFGWERTP